MTSSNGDIFRVTGPLCREFTSPGEFPTQRPVTRSFDAFFDLRLNKPLSKQPWGWWFETLSRKYDVIVMQYYDTKLALKRSTSRDFIYNLRLSSMCETVSSVWIRRFLFCCRKRVLRRQFDIQPENRAFHNYILDANSTLQYVVGMALWMAELTIRYVVLRCIFDVIFPNPIGLNGYCARIPEMIFCLCCCQTYISFWMSMMYICVQIYQSYWIYHAFVKMKMIWIDSLNDYEKYQTYIFNNFYSCFFFLSTPVSSFYGMDYAHITFCF